MKLERRLAEQEKTLTETLAQEKELKETGDFIYGNYEIIEHVLSKAKYVGIQNLENPENNKELRRYETKITDKRKRNRNRGLDARYYSSLVIR